MSRRQRGLSLARASNRRNLERQFGPLRPAGCDLICAESGEDALEILRTTVPALILMDMRLPGMDGMAAVRMIRANPATRCVPIWAVTGKCTSADVDAALASGCSGYFVKPIDLRKVANDLRAIQSFTVASLAAPTAGVLA